MTRLISWSDFKSIQSDNEFIIHYVDEGNSVYSVVIGDRSQKYVSILRGADSTDFDTNFKSTSIVALLVAEAEADINSNVFHVFISESLADGVYEDSIIISCDAACKTFNITNTHATQALNYKIWASPDNTEYEEIKSETALAALTKTTITNSDMWRFVKISAEGSGGISTIDAYVQVGS